MSFLDDCTTREISDFSGPNLIQDEEDIKDPRGLLAQDIEYTSAGLVKTRNGFAGKFIAPSPIKTLYNWLQSKANRILYYQTTGSAGGGKVSFRDLADNVEHDLISSLTALGMSVAEYGYRVLIAFFTSDTLTNLPTGATEARIWDGTWVSTTPPTYNVEKMFPRPLLKSEVHLTITEAGSSGLVTKGTHYFGVGIESYSGALTPLGPTASDLPWSATTADVFTTTASKRTVTVVVTPASTWPMWVSRVKLAMTNVSNPERPYFIPGAVQAVARGTNIALTFSVVISDEALSADGEDITNSGYFGLMTQSSSNTGPISPYKLIAYNQRMVYLADAFSPDLLSTYSAAYISNQMNPHWVTAAYHQLPLPENRKACTGGVIGSVLILTGPNWTYAYSDNTRLPTQWATPRTVSTSIGTPFINGVFQGNGYLWVAHSSGLYKFDGGSYPAMASSYEQTPDWEKINFSAPPNTLRVLENPRKRMVYVIAPVNLTQGANQQIANRLLVWDYTAGTTPDKIKYCGMWAYQQGAVTLGDGIIVYSPTNTIEELWVSKGPDGRVVRQKGIPSDYASENVGLYDDDGVGIDSKYRLGPLVRVNDAPDQYHAVNVRVRGAGTIRHRVYSLDGTNAVELLTITAALSPGRRFTRLFNKQNESCSYEIDNNATVGAFFILTAVKTYFTKWLGMR